LPDDELTEVLRTWSATQSPALADPGVLAQTLALVRADLKLAELHRSSTAKLLSPMTVVFGSEDVAAPRAAADGWRAHAGGPFEIHEVIGDHFFVHQREAELLAILRRAVGHDG
jgi:medium-chain acyl-[acyl-carrier-protein] hydrolase